MLPEVDLPIHLRATGAKAAEAWCTQDSLGEPHVEIVALSCAPIRTVRLSYNAN